MNWRVSPYLVLFCMASTLTTKAQADTVQSTLLVGAEVIADCKIVGGALDFGSYVTGQSADHDAVGSIDYEGCAVGALLLELNGGSSGSVVDRVMRDEADRALSYQIFRDAGYSETWGQGNGGRTVNLTNAGAGSIEVYGRVFGGQSVARGIYADTINITLTF